MEPEEETQEDEDGGRGWMNDAAKCGVDPDDFRPVYSFVRIDPARVVVGAVVKVGVIDCGTEWIWVQVTQVGPEADHPGDTLITAVLTHFVFSNMQSTLTFPRKKILEISGGDDEEDDDSDEDDFEEGEEEDDQDDAGQSRVYEIK